MEKVCAIVLAAGDGKRMRSSRPKVLCEVLFRPMICWIAGVLEECHGRASLEEIYQSVEGHKRAQSQQWWKEKVRQTLQINPQTFEHTGRGMWRLI